MSGTDATERLARDVITLAREQLSRLRTELADSGRELGGGAVLFAAAGACGVMAAIAAHQAALRALDSALPKPLAAAVLTAAYAGGGATLALAGLDRVRRAADASDEAIEQATRSDADGG